MAKSWKPYADQGILQNGGASLVSAFRNYAMFCVVVLSGTYNRENFCDDDNDDGVVIVFENKKFTN